MASEAVRTADRQLLTFRVAGEHLALPASVVVEIIRPPAITRVPLGPPGLAGVANLRGGVLPVVSLRLLLGSHRDSALKSSDRRGRSWNAGGACRRRGDGIDDVILGTGERPCSTPGP